MDPLWSETCWSIFKYFIILIVSTNYILCISSIIKCLTIQLSSNSMEQCPWEATSSSVSQEIPSILWNPKLHYRIHNSPIVNHINQINSVRALTSYFLEIHFKLSTHLRLGFPSSLLPTGPPTNPCRHFAEYRSSSANVSAEPVNKFSQCFVNSTF